MGSKDYLILAFFFISLSYLLYQWIVEVKEFRAKRGKIKKESKGHIIIGLFYVIAISTLMFVMVKHPAEEFLSPEYLQHLVKHFAIEKFNIAMLSFSFLNVDIALHLKQTRRIKC